MHDSRLPKIDQRQIKTVRYYFILTYLIQITQLSVVSMRQKFVRNLGYLSLFLALPVYAENPALTVAEAVWASAIGKDKMPQQKYQRQAPLAPLYLWMRIQADEEVLQVLRSQGKLPIRHKWFRSRFGRLYFDQTQRPIDSIDLGIGTREKLQKLQLEIDERGFFDWRTWSGKRNMRRGYWRVRVVYADNTPVLCEGEPCVYDIKVK